MRTNSTIKLVIAVATLSAAPIKALAFDWKACDTDVKKHCPGAKGDEQIFECLEKVEKKISKACYNAHEKYEKETGKEDKDEAGEKK